MAKHQQSQTHKTSLFTDYLFRSRHQEDQTFSANTRRLGTEITHNEPFSMVEAQSVSARFANETFGKLYEDSERISPVGKYGGTLAKLHDAFTSSDAMDTLREQTLNDPDMAALATDTIISSMDKESIKSVFGKSTNKRKTTRGGEVDVGGAKMRIAARLAVAKAQNRVSECVDAMNGLSPGLGSSPSQSGPEDISRYRLAQRISSDERLRKIMNIAGRIRRCTESDRLEKDPNKKTTMVGITTGADVAMLLPTELGLMNMPVYRTVQFAKLVERKMLQYNAEGYEAVGRGPVTILLDISGSMSGEPMQWAAAITIACLGVANRENRKVSIIPFNGSADHHYGLNEDGSYFESDGSGTGGIVEVALKTASISAHGGTNFEEAFRYAIKAEKSVGKKRSDLILITDGCCEIYGEYRERLKKFKEENGLRIFALTVNGGSLAENAKSVCDKSYSIDDAIAADDHESIANVLA